MLFRRRLRFIPGGLHLEPRRSARAENGACLRSHGRSERRFCAQNSFERLRRHAEPLCCHSKRRIGEDFSKDGARMLQRRLSAAPSAATSC